MSVRRTRKSKKPTFHILIATGGRPSLLRLLDSLKTELKKDDAVTIVFDGPEARSKAGFKDDWTKDFKANVHVIEQSPNMGHWGHAIRNRYQGRLLRKTTFLLNADDDDVYLKGSFNKLRNLCTDPTVLYIAKMEYDNNPELLIPRQNESIKFQDIGTPNGIIPFDKAAKAKWGLRHGGDYDYYNSLQKKVSDVVFLDVVFYRVY
jgi:hypothetical protein